MSKFLQAKYVNSAGKSITFGDGSGYYINESDLHDYDWQYETIANRISGFEMTDIVEKTAPVRIAGKTDAETIALKNELFNVMEWDTVATEYGKFYIGEYYLNCYCKASVKTSYKYRGYLAVTLTLITDSPKWIKPLVLTLKRGGTYDTESEFLDYPYDFPYDFQFENNGYATIHNEGVEEADFELRLDAAQTGTTVPEIQIANHTYSIDNNMSPGEYVVIDSIKKTVYKYGKTGSKTNWFQYRNRDSYIFQKIPTGVSVVSWMNMYGATLTVYLYRSEPLWN